ncbi:hypothetical protein [Pontibacter diazotrophicus]|nr:hypothetical protein [Pontibacter diazotrophicus]
MIVMITSYSRGDLTHLRNILKVEAEVFFYSLCNDTEKRSQPLPA